MAIETVARKVPALVRDLGMVADVVIARLSSMSEAVATELADDVVLTDRRADHADLESRLAAGTGSTVVAGTAQQLAKLSLADAGPMRPTCWSTRRRR